MAVTNKHCNLSDMNFFMKYMKNRYSDPDPLLNRIRIPFFQMWIRIHYYGKVDPRIRIHFPQMWIPGSGSGSKSKWDGSETLITGFVKNIVCFIHFNKTYFWNMMSDIKQGLSDNLCKNCILIAIQIKIPTQLKRYHTSQN